MRTPSEQHTDESSQAPEGSAQHSSASSPEPTNLPSKPVQRIQTQIHRRHKAPKVFPLVNEWDTTTDPPSRLRMPPDQMIRQ